MAYIVTESCIKCKLMDCVVVCPADCFYEGENMLVIHSDECIDCGDCESECTVEAIVPDTEFDIDRWLKINAEYSAKWPNIKCKGELEKQLAQKAQSGGSAHRSNVRFGSEADINVSAEKGPLCGVKRTQMFETTEIIANAYYRDT